MSDEYVIETTQKLTKGGVMGVWLFLGGPVVSGIGLAILSAQRQSFSPNLSVPLIVMAAGGMAFLAGALLVLIGRQQSHSVRTIRPMRA